MRAVSYVPYSARSISKSNRRQLYHRNESKRFNDISRNLSATGLSPLRNRDIRNAAEKSNFLSRRERSKPSTVTASVDDRSAADGERDNTEDFCSCSPASLQMHSISQEQARADSVAATPVTTFLSSTNAGGVVPSRLSQSKKALRFGFVENSTGKAMPKALKITDAQNAKVSTKLKIIAMKMTQRQFSWQDAMDILDREEEVAIEADVESDPHFFAEHAIICGED